MTVSALMLGAGIVVALPVSGEERVDLQGQATAPAVGSSWQSAAGVAGLADVADGIQPSAPEPWLAGAFDEPEPSEPSVQASGSPVASAADPVGLAIPSIGLVAPVVPTGITEDREMEIPQVRESGWYRYGASPGDGRGSAVIAAHVDFNGETGVFRDLGSVQLGDDVIVTDTDGTARPFVVTERYQAAKAELRTAELFRRGGDHVLTLVTCGGGFENADRSYTDNIVVRAVPA